MLSNHIRFLMEEFNIARQQFGLILLAEHFRWLGVLARDRICAELGQDDRFPESFVERIELSG